MVLVKIGIKIYRRNVNYKLKTKGKKSNILKYKNQLETKLQTREYKCNILKHMNKKMEVRLKTQRLKEYFSFFSIIIQLDN